MKPYELGPLADRHDRQAFCCGQEALDRYLKTQASQDVKRRVANCFVATEIGQSGVVAYYTLSATSVAMADLPVGFTRKLPRYPTVPAALMGRLGVDLGFQGRGIGAALLGDAVERVAAAAPAATAIVVHAKDEAAARFYLRHNFSSFGSNPLRLFLPLALAQRPGFFNRAT